MYRSIYSYLCWHKMKIHIYNVGFPRLPWFPIYSNIRTLGCSRSLYIWWLELVICDWTVRLPLVSIPYNIISWDNAVTYDSYEPKPYQMFPQTICGHPSTGMGFNAPQSPWIKYSYQISAGASTSFQDSYPVSHRSIICLTFNSGASFMIGDSWGNMNPVSWLIC